MAKESTLYFAEDTTGADSASSYSASEFLGMEPASASSAALYFKAPTNAAAVDTVTLNFKGRFVNACKAIAGALNSNTMTVVADEANKVYMTFEGGAFEGEVTVINA
tara:strand:+ start:1530 stop:1850 length:321 start_codon:yes stop_codon:yes gene_type:complete